jgi:hypothetical protein
MEGLRVGELPAARMAACGADGVAGFDPWWLRVDRERADRTFPRDFMSFDKENGGFDAAA